MAVELVLVEVLQLFQLNLLQLQKFIELQLNQRKIAHKQLHGAYCQVLPLRQLFAKGSLKPCLKWLRQWHAPWGSYRYRFQA
jgi:hypothetical protein